MPAWLESCGVSPRHAEATIDTESERGRQWDLWLDQATVADLSGGIVVLTGSRGSGKTQLATEMIRNAIPRRPKPRYVHVVDFFLAVRATYGQSDKTKNQTTETEAVRPYIETSLLVIDEIQERGGSDWEDRMLHYVIDKRYAAMRTTVVIGNLKRDPLLAAMGRSVSSRIAECGTFIECVGVSFRGETR